MLNLRATYYDCPSGSTNRYSTNIEFRQRHAAGELMRPKTLGSSFDDVILPGDSDVPPEL